MKRALGFLALATAVGCGGMVDNGVDGVHQAESNICAPGKIFVPDAEQIKSSKEDPWQGRKGVIIIRPSANKSPDGKPRFHLYGIDPQKKEFVWYFLDATYEDYKVLMGFPESGDPCDPNGSNPGGGKGGASEPDPARGGICAPESLLGDAGNCQGCVPATCEPKMCGNYPDNCGSTIACGGPECFVE